MLCACAGAFLHGAAGFGLSLVFVPLASTLVGIPSAVAFIGIVGTPVTLQLLYLNRLSINWPEVARLVSSAIPGIGCGLALLHYGDPEILRRLLGAAVGSYAVYALLIEPRLIPRDLPPLPFRRHPLGLLAGFMGGFFGGACAVNGPPVVVYAAIRRWPRDCFKSIIQGFLVSTNVIALTGYATTGLVTIPVLLTGVACLPFALTASALGQHASTRLSPAAFRKFVLAVVLVMGATLLFR